MIKMIDQMQDTMHLMNEKFEATLKELIESKEENLKYRVLTYTLTQGFSTFFCSWLTKLVKKWRWPINV